MVVYREVFETILFYAALWTQGNGGALLAGAGTAVALLAVIAWAKLRYSSLLNTSDAADDFKPNSVGGTLSF